MGQKELYAFHIPSVDELSSSKSTTTSNDHSINNPQHASVEQQQQQQQQQHSQHSQQTFGSLSSEGDTFDRPPIISDASITSKSSTSSEETAFVKLARRRANRSTKEKTNHRRNLNLSRPQGRPLSKETRVRLTLVPTLGILYSILVSDTMRKSLKVVKYSDEKESINKTNEEISTRNVISGFSSLLNVQTVRFIDDPTISPNKNSSIPEFSTIDEAVYNLFGLTDYSLIRVTRAAATEVGGSVLLKIETAMPGHLYLNDDEDEDFQTVEMFKDYYQESIGSIGDRPTTTFLKKRVARPRYKSDMRIYLIPRSVSCAIYCETRMFKRDLLRGFLDMSKVDRSVIVAFEYAEMLKDLKSQGHDDLITKMALPSTEQVKEIEKSVKAALAASNSNTSIPASNGYYNMGGPNGPLLNSGGNGTGVPTELNPGSQLYQQQQQPSSNYPSSSLYGGVQNVQGVYTGYDLSNSTLSTPSVARYPYGSQIQSRSNPNSTSPYQQPTQAYFAQPSQQQQQQQVSYQSQQQSNVGGQQQPGLSYPSFNQYPSSMYVPTQQQPVSTASQLQYPTPQGFVGYPQVESSYLIPTQPISQQNQVPQSQQTQPTTSTQSNQQAQLNSPYASVNDSRRYIDPYAGQQFYAPVNNSNPGIGGQINSTGNGGQIYPSHPYRQQQGNGRQDSGSAGVENQQVPGVGYSTYQ